MSVDSPVGIGGRWRLHGAELVSGLRAEIGFLSRG